MEPYDGEQETMLNESEQKKRDSDSANNEEKKLRKRRSSLAATRRSISGLVPYLDLGSDLPSSSGSGSSDPSKESQNSLKPNLLNVRMDEIIQQFEANTSRLDREYAQWRLVLTRLEKEQEQTKLLSESNISIQAEDIPQELKDLARSEYVTCELMDFATMESRVEKRFRKTYFNIEKCLQDMKLFRETINTVKCHNKLVKTSMSNQTSGKDAFGNEIGNLLCNDLDTTPDGQGHLLDIKSQLEWLMNS